MEGGRRAGGASDGDEKEGASQGASRHADQLSRIQLAPHGSDENNGGGLLKKRSRSNSWGD
jgi:hypothetical protein